MFGFAAFIPKGHLLVVTTENIVFTDTPGDRGADTFEKIAELSKLHGMEMFQKQDANPLEAMQKVMVLMQQLGAMQCSLCGDCFRSLAATYS